MPIEYLDHTADVGLRATGRTIGEAFAEAARGLFGVMLDAARVDPSQEHHVFTHAATLEELLVAWLSDLLVQKDLTGLVFSRFAVDVRSEDGGFALRGTAIGEPLDVTRHRPGCEVKGISLLGLRVEEAGGEWTTECVFDV